MSEPKIHVVIKEKNKIYFEGDVFALTSYNDKGLFDVLPFHENFISLIKDKIILHNNGEDKEMKIDNGLLKTNGNKVSVYLGV